jgi:16S rRNA G966 N2-methylase RsmD
MKSTPERKITRPNYDRNTNASFNWIDIARFGSEVVACFSG